MCGGCFNILDFHNFCPPFVSRATENVDFLPSQGSLIFGAGQLSSTVDVVLLDDNTPETAESVFIYIVTVNLLSSPQTNPGTAICCSSCEFRVAL